MNGKFIHKVDIDKFADVWFSNRTTPTNGEHKKLNAIIDKAVDRYLDLSGSIEHKEEQQNCLKANYKVI